MYKIFFPHFFQGKRRILNKIIQPFYEWEWHKTTLSWELLKNTRDGINWIISRWWLEYQEIVARADTVFMREGSMFTSVGRSVDCLELRRLPVPASYPVGDNRSWLSHTSGRLDFARLLCGNFNSHRSSLPLPRNGIRSLQFALTA